MQHGIALQKLTAFLAEKKDALSPSAKQLLHHFYEAGKDGFDYLWVHSVLYPKIVVNDKVKQVIMRLYCHDINLGDDKQYGSLSFELKNPEAKHIESAFNALSDEFNIEVSTTEKPALTTVTVKQCGTWEQFFNAAAKAIDIVVIPKK